MVSVKNGAAHISSPRDGRSIYLDGRLVRDHPEHTAFPTDQELALKSGEGLTSATKSVFGCLPRPIGPRGCRAATSAVRA